MPGTVYVQIGSQVRAQLRQNLLSREHVPEGVVVEVLDHLVCDDDGIFRLPRLWLVLQDAELNWKIAHMAIDECIHPMRVRVKIRTIARTRHLQ